MATSDTKLELSEATTTVTKERPSCQEIIDWCKNYIAHTLGLSSDKIDADTDFESLGFDSSAAVALVAEAEDWLGIDLEPAVFFEYPTIAAFAKHLSER